MNITTFITMSMAIAMTPPVRTEDTDMAAACMYTRL